MKLKSRSSAKKRVRKTGTGKLKVMKAARGHLLQQKSKGQKGKGGSGKSVMASATHRKWHYERALPYL